MKVTLVLCFLAMAVALVLGSGGGHDDAHGDAAGGHDAGAHGDAGHGDDGHGKSTATNLQLCSTLFSFIVLAALNKLR